MYFTHFNMKSLLNSTIDDDNADDDDRQKDIHEDRNQTGNYAYPENLARGLSPFMSRSKNGQR